MVASSPAFCSLYQTGYATTRDYLPIKLERMRAGGEIESRHHGYGTMP